MTPDPPEPPTPTGPTISVKLLADAVQGATARLTDVYYQIVDNTTSSVVAEVVGGDMVGYKSYSVTEGHQYRINFIGNNGVKFLFFVSNPSVVSLGESEKYLVISSMPDDEYVLDITQMYLGA